MGLVRLVVVSVIGSGILVVSSIPGPTFANEAVMYRSARSLGMGGSSSALPHGADALWQNPAALGIREPGLDVEVLNPVVSVSETTRRTYAEVEDLEAAMLAAGSGQPLAASAGLFPNILTRNFGVGVVIGATPEASVHELTGSNPHVDVAGRAAGGIVTGYGHAFFGERLAVGASAKALKRMHYANRFDEQSSSADFDQSLEEGLVGSADVGALYRFGGPLRTSVGAGVYDIVATSLPDPYPTVEEAQPYDVSRLRPIAHAGVGVQPSIGWLDIQAQLEWTDNGRDGLDTLSVGTELTAINLLSVRGGVAYGQPTAGVGVDLTFVQVDAATYAEPSLTDPNVLDRHWVVQLTAGF